MEQVFEYQIDVQGPFRTLVKEMDIMSCENRNPKKSLSVADQGGGRGRGARWSCPCRPFSPKRLR